MTATTGNARKTAEDYVRAWLAGDVDKAMSFVADDVVCEAPTGRIEGLAAYRQFLEPFSTHLINSELVDLLDGGTHAVAVYKVDTPFATDYRGVEYLTAENGKISHVVSVFDLSPMIKAGLVPQA